MINNVLEAISIKLRSLYPDFTRYIESPKSDINEPCFIISRTSATQRERLGYGTVMIDETYSVVFLCHDLDLLREVTFTVEILFRFIETDDLPLLTKNRQSQIIDGTQSVITFDITRTITPYKEPDPLIMEMGFENKILGNSDERN